MFDALQFLAGLVLLGLAFFDFVQTAIGTAGIGPISKRVARLIWNAARPVVPALKRATGWEAERAVGPSVLIGIAGSWIVLSWAAYTLLLSVNGAARLPGGGEPGLTDTIAFSGASLSTLGSSQAGPGDGWSDVLSSVAAINGMVMLTLSVSFMMNVWQTTSGARTFALRVAALHARADRLSEDELAASLAALGKDFAALVVAIRGVPVVAYFATEHQPMSLPSAVLTLCELVERVGDAGTSPGMAELRIGMHELANLEDGREGRDVDTVVLRRWAEARQIRA